MSSTLSYFAFVTLYDILPVVDCTKTDVANSYLLGQTIGGIFCSPLSEAFGRRTIYALGTGLFAAASIVVAAPPYAVAVYIGRFFQGVAAAIPATVAFGSFNDMFGAAHRVWVVYCYTLSGMIGLVLGPIFSSYVTSTIGWYVCFRIYTTPC